ncbi:MAG: hypothetical protein Q7S68_04325, partial [Deltaproteobacteria bacterium]|nr:hypothetical protein [Deltaproteobacteria bacterium]
MAFYLGEATSIVCKTAPFILLRLLVYLLFASVGLLYFGLLFVLGEGAAKIHEYGRYAVWIIGLLTSYPLIQLAREYILYLVKGGHIAVIVELATHKKLPDGYSQIQWGREQVKSRFKDASILFLVDRLVAGVIRSLNRLMWRLGGLVSAIPGGSGVIKLANIILYFSLTYVDEAILARNFVNKNETVWTSAKAGVVLYAESWREILATAVALGIVSLIAYPLLFALFMIPAMGFVAFSPFLQIPAILFAVFLTMAFKAALLEPWCLTVML